MIKHSNQLEDWFVLEIKIYNNNILDTKSLAGAKVSIDDTTCGFIPLHIVK